MARPKKEALDYFPMECVDDIGIRLMESKFGAVGYAAVVKLFQLIYGTKGYYAEWNEETTLLFAKGIGLDVDTVEEIIREALKRKIFSAEMYEKHGILTSRQIQNTYISAVIHRTSTDLCSEFLLVDYDDLPDNVRVDGVYCRKTRVLSEKNPDEEEFSGVESTQSKVKKSKEEESIVKESEEKDGTDTYDTENDYDGYDDSATPHQYISFNENKEHHRKINEDNSSCPVTGESLHKDSFPDIRKEPPDIDDVKNYAKEEGLFYVDCEWFVTYYSSRGWENISDWKTTLRRWNEKDKIRTKEKLGRADIPEYTDSDHEQEMISYFDMFDKRYADLSGDIG